MATDDDTVTDVIFFSRRLTLGNLARAFRETGKALFVAQVAIDTYHIGKTIYTECTKTKKKCPGKRTLKKTKMVAAGWTGSTVGSTVGTGIGAAFGEFGTMPGAVTGETFGSYVGAALGKKIVDKFVLLETCYLPHSS